MAYENGMPGHLLGPIVWRRSGHSGAQGNCVEMAKLDDGQIAVGNSRYPHGPALVFTREEIRAWLAGVRDGDFDRMI